MPQHEPHDPLRLVVVDERRRSALAALAPHLRQPLRGLDHVRPRHDRRQITIKHFEVHAILRHGVGREKGLELVELGIGQRFVEGAGIGHGEDSRGCGVANLS